MTLFASPPDLFVATVTLFASPPDLFVATVTYMIRCRGTVFRGIPHPRNLGIYIRKRFFFRDGISCEIGCLFYFGAMRASVPTVGPRYDVSLPVEGVLGHLLEGPPVSEFPL